VLINLPKLETSIGKLVHDIAVIQWTGDKQGAELLLKQYGVMSETMKTLLADTSDIPVDVKPVYPLAGEAVPPK